MQRSFCGWVVSLWPGLEVGLKVEPWVPSVARVINFKFIRYGTIYYQKKSPGVGRTREQLYDRDYRVTLGVGLETVRGQMSRKVGLRRNCL